MRINPKWITVVLFFGLASAQQLTAQNWQTSPKIKEIKVIQTEIDAMEFANIDTKDLTNCTGETEARVLNYDAKKTPRAYYLETHKSDVSYSFDYTYDKAGKLRYAEIEGTAGLGNTANWTFYFDGQNQVLWKDFKQKGSFKWIDPMTTMPFDAVKTFLTLPKCSTRVINLGDGTAAPEPQGP